MIENERVRGKHRRSGDRQEIRVVSRGRGSVVALGVIMLCLLGNWANNAAQAAPQQVPTTKTTAHRHASRPAPSVQPGDVLKSGAQLLAEGRIPQPDLIGDDSRLTGPSATAAAAAPTGPDPTKPLVPFFMRPVDVAQLALNEGCSPDHAVIATAIAGGESTYNAWAVGDVGAMNSTWIWSSGLWQIRGLRAQSFTKGLRDSWANLTPTHNANSMRAISNGCTDFTPWGAYTNGHYKPFIKLAQDAVFYDLVKQA